MEEKIQLDSEEFQRLISVCEALEQDNMPEDWAKLLVEVGDHDKVRAAFSMMLAG